MRLASFLRARLSPFYYLSLFASGSAAREEHLTLSAGMPAASLYASSISASIIGRRGREGRPLSAAVGSGGSNLSLLYGKVFSVTEA